jgi:uncharacterized membrane protein
MTLGPMQVLVVGFGSRAEFTGEIVAELRRLRELDVVRVADLRFVTKDADGTVSSMEASDLSAEESARIGDLAGSLVGLPAGSDDEVQHLADAIPLGTSAAVVVLEHRWAVPLREAIERNDGGIVVDEWLRASDA